MEINRTVQIWPFVFYPNVLIAFLITISVYITGSQFDKIVWRVRFQVVDSLKLGHSTGEPCIEAVLQDNYERYRV